MLRLALDFRSKRADETADLLDKRAGERESYIQAKERLAYMRAKRAELERHMLRQGIELPPDASDE